LKQYRSLLERINQSIEAAEVTVRLTAMGEE